MSRPSWLEGDWDLLRQRRLERGLPGESASFTPAVSLLLRGGVLGAVPLVLVSLLWVWIGWRQAQLARELEGLRGIPAEVQSLENQAQQRRRQLSGLQRSNEGIAKGLVAVSSGSALLTQLAAITPIGVRLTEVSVQGSSLSLKGLAVDPQAFRRVNGFSLLLARSPLFEPTSVRVLKLTREQPTGAAASKPGAALPPVAWELTARVAALPASRQLSVLQQLGADGMARRLQILERAGVLP